MSTTTADRLALLLRTKQWQRMELEKRYPSLDFDEIPFSAYRQLWMGRAYVRGLVGAWNGYGRSNSDADRDVLYDYSGHGRDIKLYNFAFEGMSGYGGYADDYENYVIAPERATGEVLGPSEAHFSEVLSANLNILDDSNTNNGRAIPSYRVRVSGTFPEGAVLKYRDRITGILLEMPTPGEYVLPEVPPGNSNVGFQFDKAGVCDVTIEMLPTYPGGLVSDGVDDYGKCIKNFALPDDYTVVAVRKIISGNSASLVNKGQASGAFMFEGLVSDGTISNYSYGQITYSRTLPALFSYLTKTSYNGEKVTAGTAVDDDAKLLVLFTSSNKYQNTVLYDLRIYDHSLTAEELQTVKDEMMADYEAATGGGISDIHYVADWDAKGRSNDEEEPMRSTWTDKATGKVIDLHNYAYARMSGWGGYGTDMSKLVPHDDIAVTETAVTSLKCTSILQQSNSPIAEWGPNGIASGPTTVRFRVTGVSDNLGIRFESYTLEEGLKTLFTATGDGVYTAEISDPAKYYRWIAVTKDTTVYPVNCDITIEQLPLYPGALVSDGVDDYGLTKEAINEEVGTALIHCKLLTIPTRWGYYIDGVVTPTRIFMAYNTNTNFISNLATKYKDDNILYIGTVQGGSPLQGNNNLYVASNTSPSENGQVALYRLILIREQLDDAQADFLKWKVEKEYRDWCKENGYEYAINQLTA